MNLFELFVKIGVDDQASKKLANITQKLGNGLKTAAKIGTAAVGVAATGITALTTAAVKNYAEYEQLVGGVDTLFKDASQKVQNYANEAYKTAGMSANDYMSVVTSFSASLIQSLEGDTEAAAEKADVAIKDMSDNANKFGSDIETLKTAYAGFAKGQFMLLDNLKLGFGGTQAEMQRLLDKAEEISGIEYDISSYADIVDAIHIVQEEMGIAGATAKEAGTTIEGSVNSMKAAWTNLVTGIADDNANFSTLVDNFVTTLVGDGSENNLGVIGNLLPRIEVAINGVGDLVEGLAPVIVEKLPSLVSTVLPKLLSAATSVVESVASVFPDLVDTVAEILTSDDTVKSFLGIITSIINAILDAAPDIVDAILEVLPTVIEELGNSIGDILPNLIEAVVQIVQLLADNIGTIIQSLVKAIPTIIESLNKALKDNFPALLQGVITLVLEIVRNLPDIIKMLTDQIEPIVSTIVSVIVSNLPAFIAGIVQIVFEIIKSLPEILKSLGQAIFEIFEGIGTGLADAWPAFLEGLESIWADLTEWFGGLWDSAMAFGSDIVSAISEGLSDAWENVTEWFSETWESLTGWFEEKVESATTWGKDLIDNFVNGLKEKWENLKSTISDVAQSIKDFIGFSEPKKGPLSNFHTYAPDMIDLFIKGVRDNEKRLTDQIASTFDFSDDIGDYDMEMAVGTSVEPYEGESFEESINNALRALVSVEENRAIDVNVSIDAEDSEMGRMLLNLLNVTATEVYA